MKEQAVKQKLKKHLGFYLVLMLCMAMVSFACWYAYEQTRNQIVMNLDSAVGDIKVMEVQTDIPKQTEPQQNLKQKQNIRSLLNRYRPPLFKHSP